MTPGLDVPIYYDPLIAKLSAWGGTREHAVDLSRSIMVGDKEIDVHCGHNAEIKAIRVRTGFETNTADSSADWIAQDFAEATEIILTKFAPA